MIHLRTAMFWAKTQRVVVMGPIVCLETSVRNDHYTLRNSPEEHSYHLLRGGSLKLRNDTFFLKDFFCKGSSASSRTNNRCSPNQFEERTNNSLNNYLYNGESGYK